MKILTQIEIKNKIDTPLFHKLTETADEMGLECYLVGGYVRDLILERPTNDIDVVVVGSGIKMAEAFSKNWADMLICLCSETSEQLRLNGTAMKLNS